MNKDKIKSIVELQTEVVNRLKQGKYSKVWDEIYLTDCDSKHPSGTLHSVMKLYNPDDNSIRLSFCYHIDGCFHTEYLENQPDICELSELIKMGNKLYADKVQHIKFVSQPDWIN